MAFQIKDVEPFILNSASECYWFRWSLEQAQILTKLIYHCLYWAFQIGSRWTRFSIEVNGPNLTMQIAYHSHTSLKIIFASKDLYWGRNLMELKNTFSVSDVNIVLFKVKSEWIFKVFSCPRTPNANEREGSN